MLIALVLEMGVGDLSHQWIVRQLLNGSLPDIKLIFDDMRCQRVVLSTESVTNEFYNICNRHWRSFSNIVRDKCDLKLFAIDRNINDWLVSYYKQAVINQPQKRMLNRPGF